MTIEEIKQQITEKQVQISYIEIQIKNLKQQWIDSSDIKIGDKISITNKGISWGRDKNPPDNVQIGIVTSIEVCGYGDYLVYNCYPLKKDGTVAKVGLFYNNERSKIEKL